VSSRTYLSIGDVLTLLRQEFPDVTISKIRFLESQGLVNPERTPSGYRKFYEQDVERLRWVLRQQREHFLPLKVIKGRLEQGAETDGIDDLDDLDDLDTDLHDLDTDLTDEAVAETVGETVLAEVAEVAEVAETAVTGARSRRPEPVLVGHAAPAAAVTGRSTTGPALPGFESRSPRPGPVGEAEMAAATFAADDAGAEKEPAPVAASARRSGSTRPAAGRAASKAAAAPPSAKAGAPAPVAAVAETPVSTMSGASMTIAELASATSMTVSDVQQLESFGLVAGRLVGGVVYYDDDALAITRLAAGFAQFGVEARHLRLHKHAAEREAGFIEQIVLPLLKQRNPESRQRAHDNVTELSRLGQALRAVLLRNALRDQLGG
jgi:DNA-binding transcriptional MerR regulator